MKEKAYRSMWCHFFRRHKKIPIQYTELVPHHPDTAFAQRLSEFTCIQYERYNAYSGQGSMVELQAKKHPKEKEALLRFFERHPIEELLQYRRHDHSMCDADSWKIVFLFRNKKLNRYISGYGTSESSIPYLRNMIRYFPKDSATEIDAYLPPSALMQDSGEY